MGWRSRFDPSKFGNDPDDGWRAAAARARRVGLRGEVIVPTVAVLLLAVALGLSALPSRPQGEALASPSAGASVVAVIPSAGASVVGSAPSAGASAQAYPAPSRAAAPLDGIVTPGEGVTIEPPVGETAVAEASPGAGVRDPDDSLPPDYPAPDEGPIGEDQPVESVPPPQELFPTPEDEGDEELFPTPEYIEEEPTFDPEPPVDPDPPFDETYPPPEDSEPIEEPTPDPEGAFPPGDPGGEDATIVPEPTEQGEAPGETPIPEETPTEATPSPTATVSPTPTARPAEVIAGDTRWTTANSPVVLERDSAVPAGSTLTVDPGVEVRIAPGVRLTIAGALRASGARFVGSNGRWEGLVGAPGSTIALDGVALQQAGSGGTAVSVTEGTLSVINSRIGDNGGGIYAAGSTVELRGNTVVGNSINGPAVNLRLPPSGQTVITGNVFAGNGTPSGSQQLLISAADAAGPLTIDGNLFSATGEAVGVTITSTVPLGGSIRCNTFSGGTIGLQIQTNRPDASSYDWVIDSNAFADQGTFGATGSVGFNFSNNWWHDPSGPADATRNPQGRGVPVGLNQQFQPWLPQRPSCAPV